MQQLAPGPSTITEVPHKTHQQPVSCVSPWWCFIRRRLTVCLWILCFTRLQNIQSSQQLRVVWFGWTLSSSGRAGGFIWPALSRRRWGWWLEKRIQLLDFAVSADHLMGVYSSWESAEELEAFVALVDAESPGSRVYGSCTSVKCWSD